MDAAAAGIEPLYVCKAKIAAQSGIDHGNGHVHELPTCFANARSTAPAVSNAIVIGQINVKDEFSRDWRKGALGDDALVVHGRMRENGANVEFDGASLDDGRGEIGGTVEALVPNVDFVAAGRFNRHGKLAVGKQFGSSRFLSSAMDSVVVYDVAVVVVVF